MVDYFDLILGYLFSPIGIILIVIIVGIMAYVKYFAGKEQAYKTQKLDKTIQQTAKEIINTTGIKQNNRFLRQSYIILGKVLSSAKILYYPSEELKEIGNPKRKAKAELLIQEGEIKEEDKDKIKPFEFIEFQVIPNSFIYDILKYLGIGIKYFLVDKEFLVEMEKNQDYIIADGVQFWRLAGVNIFSDKGKKFITAISYKKMYEQVLESELNFIPKMTYLEVRQAKMIEKGKVFTQLEQDRWANKLDKLTEDED